MTEQTRTAVIQRSSNGRPTPDEVGRYLPSRYEVTSFTDKQITISGTDYAGWTLDDYVIPRLASAVIWAREQVAMTENELQLLRSYENGPRIWDATAILPAVYDLAGKGLIEPAGDNGAYKLTAAGTGRLREGPR